MPKRRLVFSSNCTAVSCLRPSETYSLPGVSANMGFWRSYPLGFMPDLTAIALLLAQKAGATTAIRSYSIALQPSASQPKLVLLLGSGFYALASLIRLLDRSEISPLPKSTSMVVLVDPETIPECLSAPEGD